MSSLGRNESELSSRILASHDKRYLSLFSRALFWQIWKQNFLGHRTLRNWVNLNFVLIILLGMDGTKECPTHAYACVRIRSHGFAMCRILSLPNFTGLFLPWNFIPTFQSGSRPLCASGLFWIHCKEFNFLVALHLCVLNQNGKTFPSFGFASITNPATGPATE